MVDNEGIPANRKGSCLNDKEQDKMDIRIPRSGTAAKQARNYLASQGVAVTHTQMLELVARLHGYADLQAMKADEAHRYVDPHALKSESSNEYVLQPGQSPAWVLVDQVSVRIARKDEGVLVALYAAGAEDAAPFAQAGSVPGMVSEVSEEDLERLRMQYEVAIGESGDYALCLVEEKGLRAALDQLFERKDLVLSIGPYVVRSESERGYWNTHQGWVYDKRSATGYASNTLSGLAGLAADAQMVLYTSAVDFTPDAEPEDAAQ